MQGEKASVDELLPDVLLFPAGSDLHDHPLVINGSLVLQVCHCDIWLANHLCSMVHAWFKRQLL